MKACYLIIFTYISQAVEVIPKFNPFKGFDGHGDDLPDQDTLKALITESQSIHADIEHFDDKELKEIAKSTSNRKLSKEDTDYLEVVLEAITLFESSIQVDDKKQLNLHLTQLRLNWNDQHKRSLDLLEKFTFKSSDEYLNVAVDILSLSSSAVDEMIELNKVPDTFLDEQDKLENSLTQLISLIQTYNSLLHHLYLDSWLHFQLNPYPYVDLGTFEQVIQSATSFSALHGELYDLIELLKQVRQQSSAMVHVNNEYNRLIKVMPSQDTFSMFQKSFQQVNILPDQSSQLIAQINTKVHKDANDFLSRLNSKYRCYFKIMDIQDRAMSMLNDSNEIAQLPSFEFHSSLVEVLDQLHCDTQPSKDLMDESRQTLERVLLLCHSRKQIDDGDQLLSQLLNAIDEHKEIDDSQSSFEDIMRSIHDSHDQRVLRHVNRLRTTYEELIGLTVDDDSLSTSQTSYRLRSSSIESSSSALSSLSLVDYNKPRARTLSSSSTHKKLFDVTHDEDIPPVPPIPNIKDWSKSALNLPGPIPKSARKPKPRMLQPPSNDFTPARKHELTRATISSISRRTNRAVSTPTPSKAQSDASPEPKRVLSTSSSASSLKPPALIDDTPSKSKRSGKKKSSSSFHSARSPRRSFKVAYRANPKSKLDCECVFILSIGLTVL